MVKGVQLQINTVLTQFSDIVLCKFSNNADAGYFKCVRHDLKEVMPNTLYISYLVSIKCKL